MFFCSPNERFSSTTSALQLLFLSHFGKLCFTSSSQHQWGVRTGIKGLILGLLHCNQMRLLRGAEKEVEYYVLSCIPLQHCCFLFLSGQALMLYPLTFVVPVAMFHKHRIGNILSIRNLDCCFPPAILHSARARSHSPSPSTEVLSFLSHASDTFKRLTISPSYSVCHV